MKELINELESVLIECKNPILQYMDDDKIYKTKEQIIERFNNFELECYPELLELYLWKTGCGPKYIFDYSEMTGEEFFLRLFPHGSGFRPPLVTLLPPRH